MELCGHGEHELASTADFSPTTSPSTERQAKRRGGSAVFLAQAQAIVGILSAVAHLSQSGAGSFGLRSANGADQNRKRK
ncbi:unnamed protein product [Lampetra planeri]